MSERADRYTALPRSAGPCQCCIGCGSDICEYAEDHDKRREDGLVYCNEPAAVQLNYCGETVNLCAACYENGRDEDEPTLSEIRAQETEA